MPPNLLDAFHLVLANMNSIKEINRINQRELELGVAGKGSWHDQYKGGLNFEMTEGDVITILSQWGEIMDINMPRDKETGKPRGFAFVMYEDQRSTVLAVDNMNGAQVLGRTIRVDHCSKYKQAGTKNEEGVYQEPEEPSYNAMPPVLDGSEEESDDSSADETDPEDKEGIDEEDPMAVFLKQERKEARALLKGKRKREGESKEEKRARKEAKRARKAEREEKRRKKADKARARERGAGSSGRDTNGASGSGSRRYDEERRRESRTPPRREERGPREPETRRSRSLSPRRDRDDQGRIGRNGDDRRWDDDRNRYDRERSPRERDRPRNGERDYRERNGGARDDRDRYDRYDRNDRR